MIEDRGFNDTVLGHYEDTGCEFAKRCQDDCPFKDCVMSLPYLKKQMVLKADTIMNVYSCYDNGLGFDELGNNFGIPVNTIKKWIYKKQSILDSLNQYVSV